MAEALLPMTSDRILATTPAGTGATHPGHTGAPPPTSPTASAGPLPPPIRARTDRRLPKAQLLLIAEFVIIIAVWEFVQGYLKVVNPVFLPPPSKVWDALWRMIGNGTLVEAAAASFQNFLIGYSLAAVMGVLLGLLIGSWRPGIKLIAPIVWALYAMPLVAIRPMTTIWFGFGDAPIIFLVFLSSMLPIILNTMAGVSTVDPSLKRAAAVFGADRIQTYRKVILPAMVPFVLTGLRLGVVVGWILLLVSEIHGGSRGFGALMSVAQSRFRVDQAFAILLVIVVASVLSVRLIGLLERRVSSWRSTVRS
ncbi:MAG: ABC transporter permease [Chloroflexi bacterium]|nr:ABC transporter permease [Chloroflexota bacterium]